MVNDSFNVRTNSNYEYIGKSTGPMVASDIPDVTERLIGNMLDFESVFTSGNFLYTELNQLKHELIYTARYFGQQQGFDLAGNLLTHVQAELNGNRILFFNDAKNERGQYYAGHVEYGHYARDNRTFVEARPFMRPALYAVAKASTGSFAATLSDLLGDIFKENGKGYQGISNLNFGKKLGSYSGYGRPEFRTIKGLTKATERKNSKAIHPSHFNAKKMGSSMSLKTFGDNSPLHRKSLLDVGLRHTTGRVMPKSEKFKKLSKLSNTKSKRRTTKRKKSSKKKPKQNKPKKEIKPEKKKIEKKSTPKPKPKQKQARPKKKRGYKPPTKMKWVYDPRKGFIEVPR